MAHKKLTIMVSSTVYGIESLLDQIYGQLQAYGYRVWMSRRGTVQLTHGQSAFENCLHAVDQCDAFLGIITGRYGCGVDDSGLSITHKEVVRSIRKNRPRWFLVHHDVVVARQLLKSVRYTAQGQLRSCFCFKGSPLLDDIRIIDMYEKAMCLDVPLQKRRDNWVQEFIKHDDVLEFIDAQFGEPERLRGMLAKWKRGGK